MSEKQGIIKAVVVLVVICLVISGALAVVNSFTAPVSAANAEARETAARQELIPEAGSFEQVTDGLPENVLSAYVGKAADGSVAGYVITTSGKGFIEELEKVARQQLWINPADAEPRNIMDGDMLAVKSPVGEIRIEAKVTLRIVPGTVGIPQGAWHKADMFGDKIDTGGCVNTLTAYKPTPLAKGNGTAHSMIVQVSKA